MPVLQVYGVPDTDVTKQYLRNVVWLALASAVTGVEELELKLRDISIFFHTEDYDLGPNRNQREIVVVVDGLFERPRRTDEVLQHLANAVCEALACFLEHPTESMRVGRVECFIHSINPARGFAVHTRCKGIV